MFGLPPETLEFGAVRVTDRPGVVLADAGSWHQDQIEAIVNRGIRS